MACSRQLESDGQMDIAGSQLSPLKKWALWAALLLVVCAAIARLVIKARVEAVGLPRDFRTIYVSSRMWAMGENPYDRDAVTRVAAQLIPGNAGQLADQDWRDSPPIYPPTTWMFFSPISFLPWKIATVFWLLVNLASVAVIWGLLVHMLGMRRSEFRSVAFGAMFLCLGPLNAGLRLGNPVLCTAMLGMLGVFLSARSRDVWGGVLIACAIALKPQIGIAFAFYLALRGSWRACAAVGVCLLVIVVTSVGRLKIAHVSWMADLTRGIRAATAPGGINDPSAANQWRWQLLNLQHMLFNALPGATISINVLAYAISLLLLMAYLAAVWRKRSDASGVLMLSFLLVLCLLPLYHRYYDAVLLTAAMAWAVATLSAQNWRLPACVLACTLPFYWSGNFLAVTLPQSGRLPRWFADEWWWRGFALPCETWALIFLCLLLTAALAGRD